jgi:peptidoglycan/xylan/chitin deacetylase (PgdA/CDA1 family)
VYLAITIDTEEDNWAELKRPSYTVKNVGRIPALQDIFVRYGVRPTYLISHPVATDPKSIEILGGYQSCGLCEIGTHPHPWNTPPVLEDRTAFNSFMSNLPPALQFEKIKTLTETIETNFGSRPTVYRSGRWGFSDDVARHLVQLGYAVDTSIYPTWDWRPSGGPDFTSRGYEPFVYRVEGATGGTLFEVPPTIDFIQTPRRVAQAASRAIRRLPAGDRIAGVLDRLGLLNHLALSPEINDAPQMIRLADTLLHRGARVMNMFFHSPTLLEGCSPFAKTTADVAVFVRRIESFLEFAQSAGLRSVTMSELTPAIVANGSKIVTTTRLSRSLSSGNIGPHWFI